MPSANAARGLPNHNRVLLTFSAMSTHPADAASSESILQGDVDRSMLDDQATFLPATSAHSRSLMAAMPVASPVYAPTLQPPLQPPLQQPARSPSAMANAMHPAAPTPGPSALHQVSAPAPAPTSGESPVRLHPAGSGCCDCRGSCSNLSAPTCMAIT